MRNEVPPTLHSNHSVVGGMVVTKNANNVADDLTQDIIVKQGDNLQLHCPVTGNPTPKIRWLRLRYDSGAYTEEEIILGRTISNVDQQQQISSKLVGSKHAYEDGIFVLMEYTRIYTYISQRPPNDTTSFSRTFTP